MECLHTVFWTLSTCKQQVMESWVGTGNKATVIHSFPKQKGVQTFFSMPSKIYHITINFVGQKFHTLADLSLTVKILSAKILPAKFCAKGCINVSMASLAARLTIILVVWTSCIAKFALLARSQQDIGLHC